MNALSVIVRPISGFSLSIRVYYQHTDAGGIVYHANYLNFMEAARTELLRELGFDLAELASNQHVLFIVHRMGLEFRRPARLNDVLTATAEVVRVGLARVIFRQLIVRDETVLVQGQTELACVDPTSFKPVGVPGEIKEALERYQASIPKSPAADPLPKQSRAREQP